MIEYTRSKAQKTIAIILTVIMALTIYNGIGFATGQHDVNAAEGAVTWNSSTSGDNKISMGESLQEITITYEVQATSSADARTQANNMKYYLYRDKGIMYDELDADGQKVYPYEFIARGPKTGSDGAGRGRLPQAAGGQPWQLSEWVQLGTSGTLTGNPVFSNFYVSAAPVSGSSGTYRIDYTFDAARLFNQANANNMRTAFLDATGDYKLEVRSNDSFENDDNLIGSTTVRYNPYDSYRAMPEIYKEIDQLSKKINEAGYYAEVKSMGKSTGGRDMPYLIFARDSGVVSDYVKLKERAETDPSGVIADLQGGDLKEYQIPIMYSNIHADEFNGVDSILNFTHNMIKDEEIEYDLIDQKDPFKPAGQARLQTEKSDRGSTTPKIYNDLSADRRPTNLGYLTGQSSENSSKLNMDEYYNMTTGTLDVDKVLDKVFFIIVPEENVDGRTLSAREGYGGIDLNRDNFAQTQKETQNMTKTIAYWNPAVFWEQHGFVSGFQIEPCSPPHGANFEYDLLAQNLTRVGEAYGNGAISNNTTYNGFKMPMRDYYYNGSWDPGAWDDLSTAYTPEYAMLHGTVAYTVEVPQANEAANTALGYGLVNNAKYCADIRDDLFLNQVKGYERGVKNVDADSIRPWYEDINGTPGAEANAFRPKYEENDNFFPEYFVLPIDSDSQRNVKAVEEAQQWLLDNDVKLSTLKEDVAFKDADGKDQKAKEGSIVVDMHQAKRNVANEALAKSTKISGWKSLLYSEPIANLPEFRGFTQYIVTKEDVFKDKLDAYSSNEATTVESPDLDSRYTVVLNSGIEAVKAINTILNKNKEVGWITDGEYKGHFLVKNAEYDSVKDDFSLSAKSVNSLPKAKPIKKPKVYLDGAPANEFSGTSPNFFGAREKPRVGSGSYEFNYNYKAMATEMGFDVTTNASDISTADVITGAGNYGSNATARDAILDGTPYIGWGDNAVSTANTLFGASYLNLGSITRTGTATNNDAIYYADVSDSPIMAHMKYFKDDVMYNYGTSYISSLPDKPEIQVLSRVRGNDILGGAMQQSRYAGFANSIQVFQYKDDDVNMVVSTHPLTRKNHSKDEYLLISSAIFDAMADQNDPVELDKTSYVAPTASGITLGQPLSKSVLTGGSVQDSQGNIVKGKFVWVDPDAIPDEIGVYKAQVTFVPVENVYESIRFDVDVAVSQKQPIDISKGTIMPIADQPYDGTGKTPAVQFMLDGALLIEGIDYTVSYEDNINVGTAKVIVTGAGEYSGICNGTFKITQVQLDKGTYVAPTASNLTVGQTLGESKLTGGSVQDTGGNVVEGTFTWVSPSTVVDAAGVYAGKVIFVPKDDYYDTARFEVNVAVSEKNSVSFNDAKVGYIADQTYDGTAKEPEVKVTLDGKTLVKDTDYVVSYLNNIKVGTATVIVTGAGAYEGQIKATFKITPIKLDKDTYVSPVTTGITIGEPLSASRLAGGSIQDMQGNLIPGHFAWVDPKVVPSKIGIYEAKIVFIPLEDNYQTVRFTVSVAVSDKTPINTINGKIKAIPNQIYNGKAKKPAVVFTLAGKTLAAGKDYVVSYQSNIKIGKAKVVVTGAGKYQGNTSATFNILPKTMATPTMTVGKKKMTVKWKRIPSNLTKYQIQYKQTSAKTWKTINVTGSKSALAITKLTKGKKYHVRIRGCKTVNKANYYGAWSKIRTSAKVK